MSIVKNKHLEDKHWLEHQYTILERSTMSIAKELQCGTNTVNARLRKFEIPIRTNSQTKVMQLAGKKFGNFDVLERGANTKAGHAQWWCSCKCGNKRLVTQGALVSGCRVQCKRCLYESKLNNSSNVIPRYWSQILKGAIQRNIPVRITLADVQNLFEQQGGRCALSGVDITFASNTTEHDSGFGTASLDRKDSSLGYEPNNIQWVHKQINKIKNSLSNDEFLNICAQVTAWNSK